MVFFFDRVLTWEVRRAKSITARPVTPKAAKPISLKVELLNFSMVELLLIQYL